MFIHLFILTLKAPELEHYSAALQVVQQTLGGVEGGEVNSVIQQRVDVVPHSRSVERLAVVKKPETERVGEEEIRTKASKVHFCPYESRRL